MEPAGLQVEIDEAGARQLEPVEMGWTGGLQGIDQRLTELTRIAARRFGRHQSSVGRPVAVLPLGGTLDHRAGR